MDIRESQGLTVARVSPEEALTADRASLAEVADLLQVDRPPVERWTELRRAGLVVKPRMVTWRRPTPASDAELLESLDRKERISIRSARAAAASHGWRVAVRDVDDALMNDFLRLYREQVGQMRRGLPVAVDERSAVLADAASYFAVCVTDGPTMIGCALSRCCERTGMVAGRFSAVSSAGRRSGLSRLMYLDMVAEAQRRQYAWVSLGNDPNLYGHLVKAGLYTFKRSLGFEPVPSQVADPDAHHDRAEVVLRLDNLDDPTFVLSYVDDGLGLDVYTDRPDPDMGPFLVGGVHRFRVHHPAAPGLIT